jgi:hypothetical protein
MIITKISILIFSILFIGISILVVIGFLYKPIPKAINLNFNADGEKISCLSEMVSCNTNDDCKGLCKNENIEIVCEPVLRTSSQENLYGKSDRICKPKKPTTVNCDINKGGIWVWSGDGNTQYWDCVCAYPSYYGNKYEGCATLNPGVCENGTFTYNAIVKNGPPTMDDCTCNDGYVKVSSGAINQNVPVCALKRISNFYTY